LPLAAIELNLQVQGKISFRTHITLALPLLIIAVGLLVTSAPSVNMSRLIV